MFFNLLQRRGIILPFDGLLKKVNENVFQAALGHLRHSLYWSRFLSHFKVQLDPLLN